jgi:hypothetical protein
LVAAANIEDCSAGEPESDIYSNTRFAFFLIDDVDNGREATDGLVNRRRGDNRGEAGRRSKGEIGDIAGTADRRRHVPSIRMISFFIRAVL